MFREISLGAAGSSFVNQAIESNILLFLALISLVKEKEDETKGHHDNQYDDNHGETNTIIFGST